MIIRGYLRASTVDQDASRARSRLERFASDKGQQVAAWYIENASGRSNARQELERLLSDALPGDAILIESVDRLSRLRPDDWRSLRRRIDESGLHIVAVDLPLTHRVLEPESEASELEASILGISSTMITDLMATLASADYDQRRQRQRDGINKAKALGVYQGRPSDLELHRRITELLDEGMPLRKIARAIGCSPSTVHRVKTLKQNEEAKG